MNDQEPAAVRALTILLILLTGVSGLVDAASYLNLGHVFVANMTGNIVFIGFALAGAGELSLASSAAAIASFLIGAGVAGRLTRSTRLSRPRLLRAATAIELCLVVIAIGLALVSEDAPFAYAIVALLAAAMGVQSATTSRLQVRGFNSTAVLTTMLSTMASGTRVAGGTGADNGRRILAISSMLAGGLVGALLTLRVAHLAPLALAAVVLAVTCAGSHAVARRDQ